MDMKLFGQKGWPLLIGWLTGKTTHRRLLRQLST